MQAEAAVNTHTHTHTFGGCLREKKWPLEHVNAGYTGIFNLLAIVKVNN